MTKKPSATAKARKAEDIRRQWDEWKQGVSPALLRHAEAVQNCELCGLPLEQVASSFMSPSAPMKVFLNKKTKPEYERFKQACPDRGPMASKIVAEFRAQHHHGPSGKQLVDALAPRRKLSRGLRPYIIHRLIENGWLVNTAPVPWTLRPGPASQSAIPGVPTARGAVLNRA